MLSRCTHQFCRVRSPHFFSSNDDDVLSHSRLCTSFTNHDDRSPAMIGTSLLDYIEIQAAITAIRAVAPLSILHLAASACTRHFLVSPWLGLYAALEASFYLFVYVPRKRRLQRVSLTRIGFVLV